jgi:hypothetical protein
MKLNIENIKLVTDVIQMDVEFPYYGWYSNKKEEIIKIYPEYYVSDKNIIKRFVIVKIKKGWNIETSILNKFILVSNNIVNAELSIYLRDYADLATEQEFLDFRSNAFNELI